MTDKLRIDKWLWAARFYKTRSLAVEEIDKGRVRINDLEVKPSREVKVGDTLALRQGTLMRTLVVRGISSQENGRPTKRDRRSLDKTRSNDWDSRWSASSDK